MTLAFDDGVRIILIASALSQTALLTTLLTAAAYAQTVAPPVLIGGETTHVVRAGETLTAVAGRFGVSTEALIERNRIARPNALVPGQVLSIDHAHLAVVDPTREITINIPQRMLFFVEDGRVSGFPVTVGRSTWPTPTGSFTIVEKERDPVWDVPKSIQEEMRREGKPVVTRVEPSPDNPLGAHWLRLSIPGLGIHGTNAPASIYRYASHGCIRMHPDDVAVLFEKVRVGTTGVLIYEPLLLAVIDDRVLLEAHPDPYRRQRDPLAYLQRVFERDAISARIDWEKVNQVLRARAGRPEDVTAPRR